MFNKIFKVESKSELIDILSSQKEHYIIAGGTDLIIRLKSGMLDNHPLIDISGIKEFSQINKIGNSVHIGALITHQEIVDSPIIHEYFPSLVMACRSVGSLQIRNIGTIGGNIANSSPAGDSIPSLLACNADINIISSNGKKTIKLKDFFISPGKNILKDDEFISEIIIPAQKGSGIFLKNAQRKALAISKVSMAVRNTNNNFSIAIGAVYKTPVLAQKTMEYLNSCKNITDLDIEKAKDIISDECSPIDDIRSTSEYRSDIVRYFLEKAIKQFIL